MATEQDAPQAFHATAGEILASAGTHGDLSRYLQVLPGVIFNNDFSDDLIVRGGNPMENLFLVDGIEVPNINHIASEGTTGGLASMIDTVATQNVDFYTGAYDASYDERLSSVVSIHTLAGGNGQTHAESDLGFIGIGGVTVMPLGQKNSLLASAHRSLLNLVTDDIGLGGTPVYSNLLLRAQLNPDPDNAITLLSLSGLDSIRWFPVDGRESAPGPINWKPAPSTCNMPVGAPPTGCSGTIPSQTISLASLLPVIPNKAKVSTSRISSTKFSTAQP
ncbi:MAG: TonB-dependent receptor plug domain-containing protein [Acidobacteriota bacterium]